MGSCVVCACGCALGPSRASPASSRCLTVALTPSRAPPLHRNMVNVGWGGTNTNHAVWGNGPNAVMKVLYPKGSYKPSVAPIGGIGFKACPPSVLMADDVVLRYQVAFADNWLPVKGGKLPGLFISKGTSKADMNGASGACMCHCNGCPCGWRVLVAIVLRCVAGESAQAARSSVVMRLQLVG